jgi:hypothetical protein
MKEKVESTIRTVWGEHLAGSIFVVDFPTDKSTEAFSGEVR